MNVACQTGPIWLEALGTIAQILAVAISLWVGITGRQAAKEAAATNQAANETMERSNELMERIHRDDMKAREPKLRVASWKSGQRGTHIEVQNVGQTRAENVTVRFSNSANEGRGQIQPFPRDFIEAGETQGFWVDHRPKAYLEGVIYEDRLLLEWYTPEGDKRSRRDDAVVSFPKGYTIEQLKHLGVDWTPKPDEIPPQDD